MPKGELNDLMNAVLSFAQKMLAEHGEFYPYGGVITAQGEIADIGVSTGEDHPPSKTLIELMTEDFQAKASSGEYRATAIIMDVFITDPITGEKSDAIRIDLDHTDGMSISVFLPYEIKGKGDVAYGEMFANEGKAMIFGRKRLGH